MFDRSFKCFKGVSRKIEGVPRDLQGGFKGASSVSKRSSKGVSKEFQGSFKDISGSFKGV